MNFLVSYHGKANPNICHQTNPILIQFAEFVGSDQLFTFNMMFYGVILKLLPCLVLIVFTSCLIHALYQASTQT